MASLFRRATKKSLNQNHAYKTQDITSPAPVTSDSVTPELPQHAASPENEKIKCLSPVTDERENNPKFTIQPHPDQNQQLRPGPLGEDVSPVKASASVKRKSLANGAPPDSEKASYEVTYSEWVCLKGMCYKCSFQKSLYAFLCSCLKFYTEIMFFFSVQSQRSVMSESSPSGQRDFSPHLTSTTLDHLCVDDSSSYSDKPPSPALESEPPTQYIVLRSSSPELQDNSEYQLPPSSSPTDFLSQSSPVMSSTPSDSSNRSPANPQSKNAIPVLPENPLRLPGTPLTLISTPTRPPPPASLDLHCTNPHLSSYGSESLSQSSENQKTSDPHDFSLLENHNNSTQQLSKDISIPTAPVSKSSKCDNDCQGLYFCSNATHSANRSNSPFAVDSSTSDSVLPTRPNSPAHQNHPNTCICSSPASPALDDPILSSLSDDTVLSDGSDLIEPPTNPPFKLDDEIPSEPYRPSLGPSNLEDNGSILSCLSYGKVLLGLGLTDNPTDPSLKLDRNLSFAPTTNISKDCPHLSNGSVNSLESSLMKKPINPYFQLDKDSPSATSAPGLDSYSSPILSCPFPETSDPVCPHVAEENNSDPREESRYNKDQSCLLRDDLDPTPSSVLDDDDDEQVDWLIIEPVNTRESHGEAVCFSDINHSSSVCETTETDTLVISLCLRDEAEADHRQTEEINDTSSQSGEVNELPMICSRTDVTGMESLDVVFDTSVDGFESENGDMDDFFQQLDNEGRVYWAEPILVSDSSYTLKETHSFDESPRDSLLSRSSVSLDSFLSLALPSTNQTTEDPVVFVDTSSSTVVKDLVPSQSITSDTKRTSRSVSVQMSSSLSSHIVHRKDIPYVTDSKPTPLPSAFSLDTSSPLRAVQSWTDLQIQRRNQKLPERALTLPHEADIPEGRAGKAQRSRMVYSSSPSFPLLPNHSRLQDRLPGIATNYRTVSVSVDTGLGPDKEEEMYRKGNGKSHLWEGNRSVSVACCCSCDHQSHYCADGSYRKQHVLENGPVSNGALA